MYTNPQLSCLRTNIIFVDFIIIIHHHLSLRLDSTRGNRSSWSTVQAEARAGSECGLVNRSNLRTVHARSQAIEQGVEWAERGSSKAGNQRNLNLCESRSEAKWALSNLLSSVRTTCELGWVDGREGVDSTLVAAESKNFWDSLGKVEDVGLEVWDRVFVSCVTLVPVVWNSLVSWGPFQVVLWTRDGHEALQDLLVQDTLGVLGRLVRHEAVDEGEGGLGHLNATEGQISEVWVLGDGLIVSLLAEVTQDFEVVVGGACVWLTVVQTEELGHHEFRVAAILAQIALQGRAVGLVVVVRSKDSGSIR